MNSRLIRILIYSAVGILLIALAIGRRLRAENNFNTEANAAVRQAATLAAQRAEEMRDKESTTVVTDGSTWTDLFQDMQVDNQTTYDVAEAARKVFNLRRLRPGNKIVITRSAQGELRSVNYRIDQEHELWVTRENNRKDFEAKIEETPGTVRMATVSGTVNGSLFDGIIAAGERPELALRLAEIFAWDIDFNTDTQPGDAFRLVLEEKEYKDGSEPSYGRILAAEYTNSGQMHRAVLFHDPQGRPAYYSADGKSLQKAFLRSPLKFAARISSHFSLHRYHPILKIRRAHLGTDYAAPTGTPVQAIANGRVLFAARKGGNGNLVEIAHANGYESYYLHLSRILVHRGQMVQQGQRIGLVGMTGLASGPHLDFRFRKNGRFVDFERLKLPPSFPVAKADWPEFEAERDKWMALLPNPNLQNAHSAEAAAPRPDGGV